MPSDKKNPDLNELLKKYFGSEVISDLERHYASGSKDFVEVSKIRDTKFMHGIKLSDNVLNSALFELNNHKIAPLIIVRAVGETYEIVLGRKYLHAARKNKLETLPVLVTRMDDVSLLVTLIRSLSQQKEKNVVELASLISPLMKEYRFTTKQISNLTRLSVSQIANLVRILRLPKSVLDQLSMDNISFGHAKVISILPEAEMEVIVGKIIEEDLSVRETEDLINYSSSLTGSILKQSGVIKVRQTKRTVTVEFEDEESKIRFLKTSQLK